MSALSALIAHRPHPATANLPAMVGVVIIVVVLLLIPVMVMMSGGVAAAVIGQVFVRDAEVRHEGSELLDLDD